MVKNRRRNKPTLPKKFVSQKQVLSPKAPPQVNDEFLNKNSNTKDANAINTIAFLSNMKKGFNDFFLIKSKPNLMLNMITTMEGNPNPQ
jgi:hypothetical protein